MALPANPDLWTVEMLDALPDDGQRYEIIDGQLHVTPSPNDLHQMVAGALYARLLAYMRPTAVGRAMSSPSDVWRGERRYNRVQPDVYVRLGESGRPPYPYHLHDLLLVVEIESPSSVDYDVRTKRLVYLSEGVPEYWIVSPVARTVTRWRHAHDPGEVFTQRIEWHPAGVAEPFVLDLAEFFEYAFG